MKTQKENLYFSIYLYVKNHNSLPTHKYSKQKIAYYVKRLKHLNLIKRKGYGVWETQSKIPDKQVQKILGRRAMVTSDSNNQNIEAHGFSFHLRLDPIKNWDNRKEVFNKRFTFKSIKGGQSARIKGYNVLFYKKSLVIHFPESYSVTCETASECFDIAVLDFQNLIKGLSRITGFTFKHNYMRWNVIREHYCRVGDGLAITLRDRGHNYVRIKDNGKTWMTIDQSKGVPETEFIEAGRSRDDVSMWQDFCDDLRKEPTTMGEMRELMKQTLEIVKAMAEIQKVNMQQNIVPVETEGLDKSLSNYFG